MTFVIHASCQGDLPGEARTDLVPFPAYEAKSKEEAEFWGLKTMKRWFPEESYSDYKVEVEIINEVLGNTNG